MKIAFGCDHAGFDDPKPYYKPALIEHLEAAGHTVVDCGTDGPDSVDYPDFADKVCDAVRGDADVGILLCGTGIGMSMAANRHKGIRAAVCATTEMAELSREHNDANVLCIGRRILSIEECLAIVDTWLATGFSGGKRHVRRVGKMG